MTSPKPKLTHLDDSGAARMVDVGEKASTQRTAVASAVVTTRPEVIDLIEKSEIAKGDALAVARIAGIAGAKRTSDLIPLCHPLSLDHLSVEIKTQRDAGRIEIFVTAKISGKTGVEMEALVGASVAALALYDMCKAVDKGMVIGPIRLESKEGGKSGSYRREA